MTKPDLLLIDGGKTQLKFVHAVLSNSKHNRPSRQFLLPKELEELGQLRLLLSSDGILELDKNSKAFLLLQEIRDESHRFAIQTQRKKKKEGRLMRKFKNLNNIKNASKHDLVTVKGISEKIALEIKKNLR